MTQVIGGSHSGSEDSIPSEAFDACRMEAVPGRSNDLLSGEKRCNIAVREAPRAEGVRSVGRTLRRLDAFTVAGR